MDLSIIIVNWNARDLLLACLQSIFTTAEGLALEVFVIDNASTDGSADAVRAAWPPVTVVENADNPGFSTANNQGLRRSRGRYALLLNPDTEVRPGALRTLVAFLDNHPSVGACGAKLLNSDGTIQKSTSRLPSLWTEFADKFCFNVLSRWNLGGYLTRAYAQTQPVGFATGACLLLRRTALDAVGLLDEDMFMYFEDSDLCARLWAAGWPVYLVPEAEVIHHHGRSASRNRARVTLEHRRSQLRYYRKHHGRGSVAAIKTLILGRIAFDAFRMALNSLRPGQRGLLAARWREVWEPLWREVRADAP
jgi:GT2 family glycosyltransferase